MNKDASVKQPEMPQEQRLSAEEMLEVLELIKGSTSVELKLTVPDQGHGQAIKRLGFDPVEAEPRQTFFFDTPDLALNKAGVVVRARKSHGGNGDTVVKLRPVDPAKLDPELRREHGFKIELDAMPGGYVCSASYKGICTAQEIIGAAEGNVSLTSIFSRKQRAFYSAHEPADISMNELVPLGPTFLLRARHFPKGYDRRVTSRAVALSRWIPNPRNFDESQTRGGVSGRNSVQGLHCQMRHPARKAAGNQNEQRAGVFQQAHQ